MKIDGQCHCGNLRWEAEIDPASVAICHCTDCQTLSGTAFRTVVPAKRGAFRLLAGKPKVYVKTAESGRPRAQAFCGECGSPIYAADPGDDPPSYSIRLGTAHQRGELAPKMQMWARSACSWVGGIGDMPKFEKART